MVFRTAPRRRATWKGQFGPVAAETRKVLGIAHLQESHPDVPVFTAAIDSHLNDHGYIVPGLGDAGDRMFGTK